MATIANLTKKDGSFTGTLILPFLDGKKIALDPVEKKGKGPEFRVSVGGFEARLRELSGRAQRRRKMRRGREHPRRVMRTCPLS
jgi:uncharacterized protein (DUF736 family)